MRLAAVGNGGVGKSILTGTLSRVLARQGRKVLAVDLDPNPGMAYSLGLEPNDDGLPDEALVEVTADGNGLYGWGPAPDLDLVTAGERLSRTGPDGVRYLSPGKIDRPDHKNIKRSIATLRLMLDVVDRSWDVVMDLEAGTTCPYEGYARSADLWLVLVTPSWKSALAARRLQALFEGPTLVVGTRFDGGPDHPGLPTEVRIPFDRAVAEAERRGLAPIDACPSSPVVSAIEELADRLVNQEVRA